MTAKIRIFHMASFSRSGETLMLRCLNAHPQVHVVHNLKFPEDKNDFALFRRLQQHKGDHIDRDDPAVVAAGVPAAAKCLLVKNAVWEHPYPFKGFILARNPLAIYRSFGIIGEDEKGHAHRRGQFDTWLRMIDPALMPALADRDNTTMFCLLYLRKMFPLVAMRHLPVVHYERFVQRPGHHLRLIARHLRVPYTDRMLYSHEDYEEGDVGHGRIKLWQPIHAGSLDKYQRMKDALKAKIWGLTFPAASGLGYRFDGNAVTISPERRFERRRHFATHPVFPVPLSFT